MAAMKRIENDGFFSFRRQAREARTGAGKAAEAPEFGTILRREAEDSSAASGVSETSTSPPSPEEIEHLLDSVHRLGDELVHKRTFSAVQRYREAVKTFVRRVVSNSLDVEVHTSGASVLSRKRFSLVQIIDHKLDRLVGGMLQSQEPQMELMSRVEEIHGLLVDLSH
ncbi:MAG: YaaR family protein [Spirochaetaceae bacterium]